MGRGTNIHKLSLTSDGHRRGANAESSEQWAERIGLPTARVRADGVDLDQVRRLTQQPSGNELVDQLETFGRAAYHYGRLMRRAA